MKRTPVPAAEAASALAQLLVSEVSLEDTLRRTAELGCSVTAADMAAATLVSGPKVKASAATDSAAQQLDDVQYQSGRGPCLQALRSQQACIWAAAGAAQSSEGPPAERWPDFARLAGSLGLASALAVPVIARGKPLGTVAFYCKEPGSFDELAVLEASDLADRAAIALANSQVYWDARQLSDNLNQALRSRATIDHAIGILMARGAKTPEDAFQLLVRISQRQNQKLRDIASEIVQRISQHSRDIKSDPAAWPAGLHVGAGPRRSPAVNPTIPQRPQAFPSGPVRRSAPVAHTAQASQGLVLSPQASTAHSAAPSAAAPGRRLAGNGAPLHLVTPSGQPSSGTRQSQASSLVPAPQGDAELKMAAAAAHRGVAQTPTIDESISTALEGTRTLAVMGELDLASAPELRRQVTNAAAPGVKRLELDLSAVEFIDAAGLSVLVEMSKVAAASGCALVIRRPSRAVRRLLELLQVKSLRRGDLSGS